MGSNELALCWEDHHGDLFNVFKKLLAKKSLVDCTLAAEGKFLKAHRIVLSACSPYFEILLNQESDKHPILFLKDIHFEDLKTLIEFVYNGEIRIPEDRLVEFLNLAEALQIKGLGGAGNELPGKEAVDELTCGKSNSRSSQVSRKRFRHSSNSESSSDATDSVVKSKKRIQHNVDHKVQADASSVPSPSCKRSVVSDEQDLDVSKGKVKVSNTSAHLPDSINSEQLITGDVISKSSEEILGLKTEFEQVILPENDTSDMLLEEDVDVETVINEDQPSNSHQFSDAPKTKSLPDTGQRFYDKDNDFLIMSCLETVMTCNANAQHTENVSNSQWSDNEDENIPTASCSNFASNIAKPLRGNFSNPRCCDATELEQRQSSNLTNDISKDENLQQYIVRKLVNFETTMNRISTDITNINANQKLILDKLSRGDLEVVEKDTIDVFQDLPLKNMNDLEALEIKLQNDLPYRNQMMKQLGHLTCQNMKSSCLRLMKAILSNKVANNYSWYGAKKKLAFSKLNICKIIISVIRKAHPDNMTDEQISTPIKIWLAHAKERIWRKDEIEIKSPRS